MAKVTKVPINRIAQAGRILLLSGIMTLLWLAVLWANNTTVRAESVPSNQSATLVVSGENNSGAYYSPTSVSYVYVPTGQSASVTLQNISNGKILAYHIVRTVLSGSLINCTDDSGGQTLGFASGTSANQTLSTPGQPTLTKDGQDIYCVLVSTYDGSNTPVPAVWANSYTNVTFSLSSSSGSFIGTYAGDDNSTGTGYFDDSGTKWDQELSFATPCSGIEGSDGQIRLYDLDNYYYGWSSSRNEMMYLRAQRPNINVYLTWRWRSSPAGTIDGGITLYNADPANPALTGNVNGFGWYETTDGKAGYTWVIGNQEGYNKDKVYTLLVQGIGSANKIRIRLPYDQIYANNSCGDTNNNGSITADCVAGVVSVLANITGEDGKDYIVKITQPNGVTQTRTRTGSGSVVFDNFSWPMNGISASVSGTIALAAPPGSPTKALAPGTFVCLSSTEDPRCPENPSFFGVDLWKPNIGVTRPLPAVVGTDGGYTASDYKTYSYKNDDLQNIKVIAISGGVNMSLPHRYDNISVQADYQDLVNTYPYDTHAVAGTANFVYVETYKQLIDVKVTWTRTVMTAASYTTQQWSGTSPGAGWYSIGQRGGETVLVWATTAPKGFTATGNSRENAKGETEYEYIGTTPIEYLWEKVVPATYEPQTAITTAYTAPPAPARGAYPEPWTRQSVVANYQPDVKTEKSANATILFPTLTDCLYRKLTITLESARAPTWDNLEAPSTATFYTELIALFEPTDPSRTSLRVLNRANAGAVTFTPNYLVSGRPLTFHTSGDFKLPTSSPSIPLGGTTMGFGTRSFNSSDILSVSRTGGGTIVNLDDILCGSMKGDPRVLYVNSSGVMVRNGGGITEYTLSCDAATICTAFGGGQCIENHPYFRFFNSDAVVTGMPFAPAPPTPCTASGDDSASIRGFSAGSGRGASSQVGLMAPGDITGVDSSIPSNLTGTRLTLSNLGLSGDCITNLYDAPSLEKVASWPGVASMVNNIAYQVNGNLSIAGGIVPSGVRSAVYVDGNVTITDNISYAGSGSYATTMAMPYFMIVATGSIYIDNSVTSIDAVLVSQGGQVSTCTNADRTCTNNFILNGAVVANQLRPRRTAGTPVYSNANEQPFSGNIGDSFRMIPEVILARPPLPKDSNTLKYDSITELPPIF